MESIAGSAAAARPAAAAAAAFEVDAPAPLLALAAAAAGSAPSSSCPNSSSSSANRTSSGTWPGSAGRPLMALCSTTAGQQQVRQAMPSSPFMAICRQHGYDMQRRQHGAVGDYMRMQYELACASSSGRHRQQDNQARGQYNSIQCRKCSCQSTEQQHALLCTTMLGDAGRCWRVAVLWGGAPHLSDTLQLG